LKKAKTQDLEKIINFLAKKRGKGGGLFHSDEGRKVPHLIFNKGKHNGG